MTRLSLLLALLLACSCVHASKVDNVAFYYGNEAPIGTLMAYDWVILQQDQTADARLDLLNEAGSLPIAYVSIGEIARSHRLFGQIRADWLIGTNAAWASQVLDLRKKEVRDFILDRLIGPALTRGFQGVFLDTMDSHLLSPAGKNQPGQFAQAQQQLLESIRSRHPGTRIVLNRGFHLASDAHHLVDGLAIESWRRSYDAGSRRYGSVSEADRQWLDQQLASWRAARPDMPFIAIDYVENPAEAPALANQLRQEGFIPWISNPDLTRLGPSLPEQVRRHILVMHDQPEGRMDQSAAHRQGGILLEHLGLVPVYRSTQQTLLREPATDRYAGILLWLSGDVRNTELCNWLIQQQQAGLPVVIMGRLPGGPACQPLSGSGDSGVPAPPVVHSVHHASVGTFEGRRLPTTRTGSLPIHREGIQR